MAVGEVFLTNVKHGTKDGTEVWVDAGTDVGDADIDSDALDELRRNGAVGMSVNSPEASKTMQAQADRIAQLEAALAQANDNAVKAGVEQVVVPDAPGAVDAPAVVDNPADDAGVAPKTDPKVADKK